MTFHVGQRVECVDDAPRQCGPSPRVKRGAVYTVAEITCGGRGLWVKELPPRPDYYGFYADRFRPLIERKSSTEAGFSILDDIRKRETFDEPVKPPAKDDVKERLKMYRDAWNQYQAGQQQGLKR